MVKLKKERINLDIIPASAIGSSCPLSVDGIPVSNAQTIDDGNNDALVADIAFVRPDIITTPNNVLVDQNYTNRGEYQEKRNINLKSLREKYKDDELAEYLERPRYGLELTPDEKIFFYECLFGWYNGQCINASDPDNKFFLVNSITGRYGDVVIGLYENDEPHIMWQEMAEDFQSIKNGTRRDDNSTKTALARRDDQTRHFKDMVSRLVKDDRKRFIVAYLEQNEFGETVNVENFVRPLTLETVNKKGVKFIVLRFADFMTYQSGRATTKYPPARPALMKGIQSNDNAKAATLNLLCQIRVVLSASIRRLRVNKKKTKEYNDKNKRRKAYIIEREFTLKTLIMTTSKTDISREHHKDAREDFGKAIKNLMKGGVVYAIDGNTLFMDWFKNGARKPAEFKKWLDFYTKAKVILYLVKDY